MTVVDAFREAPIPPVPASPAQTPAKGRGERSLGKQTPPKAASKGRGRAEKRSKEAEAERVEARQRCRNR